MVSPYNSGSKPAFLGLGELECPRGAAIAGCAAEIVGCESKCPGYGNAKCYFNTCSDPQLNGKPVGKVGICAPVYLDSETDEVIPECINLP